MQHGTNLGLASRTESRSTAAVSAGRHCHSNICHLPNHQQQLTVSQSSSDKLWWIACTAVDTFSSVSRVVTLTASFTLCCKPDVEYDKHTSHQQNKQRPLWLQHSGQEAYDLQLASRRLKSNTDTTLISAVQVPQATSLQDMVNDAVQRLTLADRSRYHHSRVSGHKAGGFAACVTQRCSPCNTRSRFSLSMSSSDCPSAWGWSGRHAARKVQAAQMSTLPGCHCVPDRRQLCNSSSRATSCPALHAELGVAGDRLASPTLPATAVLLLPE